MNKEASITSKAGGPVTQTSVRNYLKASWFVGLVTFVAIYLLMQVLAMLLYVLLPEPPSDTVPYFPHKIYLPDGSSRENLN
jgi:hypothetical protein